MINFAGVNEMTTAERVNPQSVILEGLTEILGKSTIHDVRVNRDFGYDGDPVLRILVISNWSKAQFDVTEDRIIATGIDTRKLARVFRFVRQKLDEIGEDAFPIISYMSKDEMPK